jgi:predicted helicase
LAALLNQFFSYTEPDIEGFEEAIDEFKERVPDLARGLVEKIQQAHKDNKGFQTAFEKFFELCRTALNPNIRVEAVDEMLVQHLLTERLFRTIFNNPEFVKRNAIAAEVERVIDALVSHSFDRTEYLKSLDRFYRAIEGAARLLPDFSEKQHFLNTVYERFFQGYSVKLADTMGIVYTPQEIVNFMCASVSEVLEKEFGKSLSSPDVYIIDPCTGTGNFVVNLLRRMPGRDLPRVYREQLFANEVMLLPYYIASLNIEHAYYELTGKYESFEGLCFVDTLDLAEGSQHSLGFMTQKNAERVERQRRTPITVVIGNPPYNVGQINENDNNKNRKYEVVDRRVSETYARASTASNRNALSDAYVKFYRWATDRLQGRDGIVCFVSNNGFLKGIAFDGFRKHLLQEFTNVYHLDFKGNARTSGERRKQEGGNIFHDLIRCGVGITVLVRNRTRPKCVLSYHAVPDYWKARQKADYLASFDALSAVPWNKLLADGRGSWLVPENVSEFNALVALGTKAAKADKAGGNETLFWTFCQGVKTNRDEVVYDFQKDALTERIREFIENYNAEVDRFKRSGGKESVDDFVHYDKIKWSRDLKAALQHNNYAAYEKTKLRPSLYRPFCGRTLYFDRVLNEEVYSIPGVFPKAESENRVIALTAPGSEKPFLALAAALIVDFHLVGAASSAQCFPFYTYGEDGLNRHENITDWALGHFRECNGDKKIAKWDIFYYVYGVLHHPEYRAKYAENLKRELPRIPLAKDFWGFSKAGKELARLHIEYESLEPYPLKFIETSSGVLGADVAASSLRHGGVKPPLQKAERRSALQNADLKVGATIPLSYRIEDKMRLSKDHRSLKVNDSLTLGGIPAETFEYRLGNRSALEWVIDQYQVTEDKHSGIRSDPNRADDPEYIVRLVGQVVRVSLETVRLVSFLPPLSH